MRASYVQISNDSRCDCQTGEPALPQIYMMEYPDLISCEVLQKKLSSPNLLILDGKLAAELMYGI